MPSGYFRQNEFTEARMKITVLTGSPVKNGNTAALVSALLSGITGSGRNVSVDDFFLNEMNIHDCRGCFSCQRTMEAPCVIRDDMDIIYKSMAGCDLMVLAAPVYWWHIPGRMKTVVDRWMALCFEENSAVLSRKKVVFFLTYGVESPTGNRLVMDMFGDIARWLNWDYTCFPYHAERNRKRGSLPEDVETTVRELGRSLTERGV